MNKRLTREQEKAIFAKKIWKTVPKDYRSITYGKKYVLARDNRGGTVLVPVDSKEAKQTWGKYIK